jgi:hypothetical protein
MSASECSPLRTPVSVRCEPLAGFSFEVLRISNHLVRVGLPAAVLAFAMAVLFAQAALADPRDFTLENDSLSSLTHVYLSPSSSDSWGNDSVAINVERKRGESLDSCRRSAKCIVGKRPGPGGECHQDTRFAPSEIEPGRETGNRPAVRRHQHVDIGDLRTAGHWRVVSVSHRAASRTPSSWTNCFFDVARYNSADSCTECCWCEVCHPQTQDRASGPPPES